MHELRLWEPGACGGSGFRVQLFGVSGFVFRATGYRGSRLAMVFSLSFRYRRLPVLSPSCLTMQELDKLFCRFAYYEVPKLTHEAHTFYNCRGL